MPIHAVCPECRSAYDLAEEQRGKKVRCKKCATVFVVGAAAQPPREETVREVEAVRGRAEHSSPKNVVPVAPRRSSARDDEDDDREARRRPAPRKKSGGLGPVLLIGGLAVIALVVIVGGVGLIFGLRWLTKDEAAPTDPKIAAGWRPVVQGNQANNINVNKPPEDKQPEDNAPVRFPVVRDDPEDANADGAPVANGELARAVLRKVKRRTALILVTIAEGHASGTGFFGVEDNVLVTNAHVLGMLNPDAEPPKTIDVVVDSGVPDKEQKFGAQILAVDRDADLAVLRVILRPGQESGTIPKPLEVKPASDLMETQKVYVFGFPFGPQLRTELGTAITVSNSEVSSLRRDGSGRLAKVQVNGGMEPGNSGGPVVNADGQVVGVAVSVIRNTKINFAVPGERVRDLLQGRIKEKGFGQPYYRNSEVIMPVTIQMVDPLTRITEVSLDVWTGDANKPRPAILGEAPKILPGDSEHKTAKLVYQVEKGKGKMDTAGKATGDVVLPPLPPGKVYYVQPSWVKGEKGTREWDRGDMHDMQPVERKSAKLVLQQQKGERTLTLETARVLDVHGAGGRDLPIYKEKFNAQIREKTTDVGSTGATMKLQYSNVTLAASGESQPEEAARLKNLPGHMSKITAGLVQDPRGNLQESSLDVQAVPVESRQQVLTLNAQTLQALEALAVPILKPNETVNYNESWTAARTLTISTHEIPQAASFTITYTLLGTRKNAAGREEAVIGVTGVANGPSALGEENQRGKASGTAVVDLATGQVTSAELTASLDTALNHETKATGTLKVKLKRTVQ